jgi:two-component system, cell cycle response regulator DivK
MTPIPATSPRPLPLALVADADPGSREMYVECMKLANWAVVEAMDGPNALAVALSRRPDVIVADSHLPGISGYDLCNLLRRDLATRATPIVLVTSDGMAREMERARAAGATSVMIKPCLPDTLVTEAHRLLESSRVPRGRPGATHAGGSAPVVSTERQVRESNGRSRRSLSRTHLRGETDLPPSAPPALICPDCDRPLDYKSSHIGGVSVHNAEQWDYFVCTASCGMFQYRQRTRKLRKV